MPNYSKFVTRVAGEPMSNMLEDFQIHHINEDSLQGLKRFFMCMPNHVQLKDFGGNHLPGVQFAYALRLFSSKKNDLSIFSHLISTMVEDYDNTFILQATLNLVESLSSCYFPSLPFLQIPSSSITILDSISLHVPEAYSHLPATPTNYIEKMLGKKTFTNFYEFWYLLYERKTWSDQTKRIWESYKNYKNDTNPKYFRFNFARQGGWDWIASFNYLFLSQLSEFPWPPSEHFPTLIRNENDIPLRGKINLKTSVIGQGTWRIQGQLDFHVRPIHLPQGSGDWKEVRVVAGVSTNSAKVRRREKFIEIAAYVSQIFCAQPLRRFVHGFCLFDKEIEFWLIDRTGAFSSGLISIEDDEQLLVRAISSYLLMSDEELGIDTTLRQVDGRSVITIADDKSGQTREIEINPRPLTKPRKLISNGTTCYRSLDDKLLVKYTWGSRSRMGERFLLKEAKQIKGVVNLVASDIIHISTDKWLGISCSIPRRWNLTKKIQPPEDSEEVEHEEEACFNFGFRDYELHRVVLSPYGLSLKSCRSVLKFLTVMRDAIMGHQRLYFEKKIIHGDISEGNIIVVTPTEEDRSRGILIDLDNSISLRHLLSGDRYASLAGTIKFMAFDKLLCITGDGPSLIDYKINFNHDLQSFFYVFLTGCVEYGRDNGQPWHDLDSWDTGNKYESLINKVSDIKCGFEIFINTKFSSSFFDVKGLALELHRILFGSLTDLHGPSPLVESTHNDMILAFNRTIGKIEAGKIPNRTWTDEKTVDV